VVAADLGAVGEIVAAGSGALDHHHRVRSPVPCLAGQLLLQLLLGHDLVISAEQVLVRPVLPAAGGQDDRTVVIDLLRSLCPAARGDDRGEIADEPGDVYQVGIGSHGDLLVLPDRLRQLLEVGGGFVPGQGGVEHAEVAAQLFALFQQQAVKTLGGQGQGRSHAGDAAADDQRPGSDRHGLLRQGLHAAGLGHGHPHQVPGFVGGRFGLIGMDPGALVADVDHLDQAAVEPGVLEGLLKERFVGPGGAGGDDHPVQPVFPDLFLEHLLGVLRAGIEAVGMIDHPLHAFGGLLDLGHIDHRADIDAAMADKDADADLILLRLLLGVGLVDYALPPLPGQHAGGDAGGGRCLGDAFRNILGSLEGTGDDDPLAACLQRGEGGCPAEVVAVQFDAGHFGDAVGVPGRFHAHRQDNHVVGLKGVGAVQGGIGQPQLVLPRSHIRHPGPDKPDAHGLCPLPGLVELLALGADVHVVNGDVRLRVVLLGNQGLLDRIHAADRGAVTVAAAQITRTHALNEGQPLGMAAVGKALDLPPERAGGGGHPLELDAGDDVRVLVVAVFLQGFLGNPAEPRGQNDGAHLQLDLFGLLIEVDRFALADRHADLAGLVLQIEAGARIDVVGRRHRLGIVDVNRPGYGQPLVVLIDVMLGAVLGAQPAGRAAVGVDVAGPQPDPGREVAGPALQGQEVGIGEHFDIGRPTGLHQFRRQYSERAVIGRKGLVELGHDPADHRVLFHQIDIVAEFGEVERGLHSGNASA